MIFNTVLPAGHVGTTGGIGTCHHPGTPQRNSVNLAMRICKCFSSVSHCVGGKSKNFISNVCLHIAPIFGRVERSKMAVCNNCKNSNELVGGGIPYLVCGVTVPYNEFSILRG